jgi:DNA mismatch repair protein MutL
MSETDARLAFERHATSKITSASDLFAITTKGRRGPVTRAALAFQQSGPRRRRRFRWG